MMDKEKNNTIDGILNSLDGIGKAVAPDFFYTRLRSRMEKELLLPAVERKGIFRPAFAIIALFLILVVNATVLFVRSNARETFTTEPDLQSFASEYRLTENTVAVYDLNSDR